MKKGAHELKVGLLAIVALSIALLFAWMIGGKNPFSKKLHIYLTYRFAGGIEEGSPVRLAGIKVGKVEDIEFTTPEEVRILPNADQPLEAPTALKIKISLSEEAARLVRKDSRFYINLAGLIGERYIEITPGTVNQPLVAENEVLRGIDPPRIDQLISQSFNLAGKIQEILENNEGDITKTIKLLSDLSANLNKTVTQIEKSKLFNTNLAKLVTNLTLLSEDMRHLTAKAKTLELKETLDLVHKLLKRAETIDKEAVQKFFQKEGIRTRIF